MQQSTTNINMDQCELPPELSAKPLALIGISGLDTVNNAVHKSIWETFSSNRRVERSPVVFKLIGNAHEFPVVKPKRNSYEWYIPKGILKKNWMNKYLNEIPAVISVFYDLDWNDSQWNEKMIECASRVQSIRAALEGRNTRIVLILIQDTLPLPTGEDALATERGVALCASCELNAKALFQLPHGDHLQGYVVRLENAFYDLAQNYYYVEARNIKSHREHLNKNTHQYLFVRHQFKMGFLNELRQDNHTAHKHYTHAYNNLLEIRIIDTNAMEIRTVAGFVNYKLCRLMFGLGLPRDAISQFRAHTDRFKIRTGFQELAFEHHAWMSKQFSVFGDIFDEAVKLGLPAVQAQHPGVYYQQAAQHAILRKKSCHELCSVTTYPTPDPLENLKHVEFYGQRAWRPGKVSAEPPDPQLESKGIQALQYLEKQVNHSNIIISLYGLAISQYKTYRCLRMRRHLVVQMADEYYNSQDYGKALTLFTHMLWDYRTERWWLLLTDILSKALRCAFLTANIQDYVMLSLELLGTSTTVTMEQKKQVFDNLNRIFKKEIPEAEPQTPTSDIQSATLLWKPILTAEPLSLSLDMGNILSCIDSKARFLHNKYQGDQQVAVELYIKNTCPFPLKFIKVSVSVNTPGYSSEFAVNNQQPDGQNLQFNYNEVKRFLIEFMPDPNDIGKEIQIGAINLCLGNQNVCCIDLKFSGMGTETSKTCPDLMHFRRSSGSKYDFDNLKPLPTALIVPRDSKLTVKFEHLQPALLGEWYEITILIINEEKYFVENLQLEVTLTDDAVDQNTEFCLNDSGKPEILPLQLKKHHLKTSDSISMKIYMRCHNVGPRNVGVKITYLLKSEKPVASIKEEIIHIPVVKPFDISTKFLTMRFGDMSKFYVGEPFILNTFINCLSSWPIVIESTTLEFSPAVKVLNSDIKSQVTGLTLRNGDIGSDVYVAEVYKQTDTLINIGQYSVKWKRENGNVTVSQMIITGLSVDWLPLDVQLPLPAFGLVRTPQLVSYKFYNRSQQLIQLEMNMEASEAFMFAGYKQLQLSILPESTKILQYNLYPLVSGCVKLPKLTLTVPEGSTEGPALRQEQLNSLIERALPRHFFIMPQSKGMLQGPEKIADMKVSPTAVQ